MLTARLLIHQAGHLPRGVEIPGGRMTIGRAPDNAICLAGDTDVSRYHAIIESRGDEFWVVDLRSANGTTVNGVPLELDRKLKDGDIVGIGGISTIEVHLRGDSGLEHDQEGMTMGGDAGAGSPQDLVGPPIVSESPLSTASGISPVVLFAAIGGGLLLTALVAGLLFYKFSGGCHATARFVSPQSGTTVRGPLTIRVEAEGTKCIDRLIYQLDGEKIASSEFPPYDVVLDPTTLSDLKGEGHILSVTVEDNDGNRTMQSETVLLAFDTGTKGTEADNPTISDTQPGQADQSTQPVGDSSLSVFDVKDLVGKQAKRISAKNEYIFDREFLEQVRLRTSEYRSAGFYERARDFRDVINDAFVGEQGLEPSLGYVMAMSRSKFALGRARIQPNAASGGADQGQGLWMLQPALAQNTGYIGRCGNSTLADPDQKCSAIVASMYMKFLVVDLFSGDYLYAVAAYGLAPKEAAQFRDQLPPDRRDFWKVLKSAEQRDRVVRFFAAGIVTESPQRFGLGQEKPLSNLYPKK